MGSAALSHLRIPAVVAVGLLCFILVIAVGDASGPARTVPLQTSQIDPSVDGVVTVAVELEAGHVGPGDALDLDGAAVELPVTRSTLLLKASLGSNYAVRFRVGETWSDWSHLLGESDEAPDTSPGTERAMGPLRVDEGADLMELVLTAGTDRSIDALFLLDVDPGSGADPQPTVAGTQQSRGVERPAIVPRSGWEAAGWASGNDGCEDGPWYADNIQAVVVHHTVTTNNYGPEEVDDLMRAVYYGHVNVNGWCDIGYNFVVDRFGTVWEGRTGGVDLPVIGGHAKGFNTSTAGIALLGQHHPGASPASARPSEAAAAAVESLAAWKLGLHGVDPLGSTWLKNRSSSGAQKLSSEHWHLVPTVLAHRDIGLTSCPGDHGVDVTRPLPDHLSAGHPGSLPYQFDGWTPADIGSGFVTVDGRGGLRPSGSAALAGIGQPAANNSSPLAVPSPPPVAVAAVRTGAQASGYVLHSDGVVHAFGTSPGNAGRPAGESVAVDVAMASVGGWVISADGVVHGFGGAQNLQVGGSNTSPVVAGAVDASGRGYLLGSDGRLRPVGAAPERQANAQGIANVVDVTVRPGGSSGWVLTAEGDLIAFGGAPEVEITASRVPSSARRYRALVASESGAGGWLLTDDGQLWPFGNERLIPGVSTTVGRGDAIDVALVSPVVDAEFVASSTGLYLDAVVEVFLDRPATAADYGHWEGRLRYQGGRQTVTLGLARSQEWAGLRIDAMYRDVLGRSPDESGRSYWLAQMAAGLALERVGVYFYGSDEYVADAGSANTYVTRLYRVLLGREPDQAGLNYWRGELQSGQATPADVASGFYASVESRRDRVSALYREVLDRPPDSNGLGYWAQRLLEIDDVVLAAELAASDEFHARAIG